LRYFDWFRNKKIRSDLFKMKTPEVPCTCPHCGHPDEKFHPVRHECGRPYLRDFFDTQMHPRDPNSTGIYSGRFREGVFLVLTLIGLGLYLLSSFGVWE
jgi:hypothetical protein